jgi:hypothetical protein
MKKLHCVSVTVLSLILLFVIASIHAQELKESIDRVNFQEILEEPLRSAGHTVFNQADRLAVRNLLAAYYMTYDEAMVDANADLFWSESEFIVRFPDREDMVITKESWINLITERFKVFKEMKLQRRHLMGEILFLEETENSIHTVNNGLAISVIDQKETILSQSLLYELWFEKRESVWKINRFKIILDGILDVESEVK